MDYIRRMPLFSRTLCVAASATTVLVFSRVLPVDKVFFNAARVRSSYEVWRLLSTFLYAGAPWRNGWLIFIHLLTLFQVTTALEEDCFLTRPADFAWQATVAGSAIVLISIPLRTAILFPALLTAFATVLAVTTSRAHITFAQGFLSLPPSWIPPALVILQVCIFGSALAALPTLSGVFVGYIWALLLQRYPKVLAAPSIFKSALPDQPDKQWTTRDESKKPAPRFGARTWDDINPAGHARAGPHVTRSNFRDMGCATCG